MNYKIVLNGKFPGLNDYIKMLNYNRYAAADMKRLDEGIIAAEVLSQFKRRPRITKPVHIAYRFYEPNKKRDLDNIPGYFHKIFQDALVRSGVLANDGWKNITGFSDDFYCDRMNPRIEIEIREVGEWTTKKVGSLR